VIAPQTNEAKGPADGAAQAPIGANRDWGGDAELAVANRWPQGIPG
jgi:hypothetical protein